MLPLLLLYYQGLVKYNWPHKIGNTASEGCSYHAVPMQVLPLPVCGFPARGLCFTLPFQILSMQRKLYLLAVLLLCNAITFSQNIGIGTTTPAEKLEVIGNTKTDTLKANSIKIIPNAGLGKVLTSDANGIASWQTSAANIKAVNGLTKSTDSVKLGGIMVENTAIRLNGTSLSITDTGSSASLAISQPGIPLTATLSATATTQTFTVSGNGNITSVELYVAAFGGSSITIQVKDVSNNILATVSNTYGSIFNNWSAFSFSNLLISNGQQYSLFITSTGTTQIHYDNTNPYSSGSSSIGATADIAFKIFSTSEKNLLYLKENRIGINTNTPGAALDVNGTIKITDGSQAAGKLLVSDAGGKASWQTGVATNYGGWGTLGNAATTAANFIGTTDNRPLVIKTNNIRSGLIDHTSSNYFIGQGAGQNVTTGIRHIAIGQGALANDNTVNTYSGNIAIGDSALHNNGLAITSFGQAEFNIAIGSLALKNNTVGYFNTAIGSSALELNTTGNFNSAIGPTALQFNVSGISNTALGPYALRTNTQGSYNTAIGQGTLQMNKAGSLNTAIGFSALRKNDTSSNIATGAYALYNNTKGTPNIAIGNYALYTNTSQNGNIAIGDSALHNNGLGAIGVLQGMNNIAIGLKSLKANTSGYRNTSLGNGTLLANTTGNENIAIGFDALNKNTIGQFNTAVGTEALYLNTSGSRNTAVGYLSLQGNETGAGNTAVGAYSLTGNIGNDNTAVGYGSMEGNLSGNSNTATGKYSLFQNISGINNSAFGKHALYTNTIGNNNTALGAQTLEKNINGNYNTAVGSLALLNNIASANNTAVGYSSLSSNISGENNTAVGVGTLSFNNNGQQNVAVGSNALLFSYGGSANVGIGYDALRSNIDGGNNTAVGYEALSGNSGIRNTSLGYNTGSSATSSSYITLLGSSANVSSSAISFSSAIGHNATVNTNLKIRIGDPTITVIEGQVGWSFPSDGRFKSNIQEDVPGLKLISQLRPVSYNFDTEKFQRFTGGSDENIKATQANYNAASQIKHSGFIAQELEAALKQIGYDFSGLHKPQNEKDNYSIAYDNFVPILTKAIQELDAERKRQKAELEDLKKQMQHLSQQIETLLQKK